MCILCFFDTRFLVKYPKDGEKGLLINGLAPEGGGVSDRTFTILKKNCGKKFSYQKTSDIRIKFSLLPHDVRIFDFERQEHVKRGQSRCGT